MLQGRQSILNCGGGGQSAIEVFAGVQGDDPFWSKIALYSKLLDTKLLRKNIVKHRKTAFENERTKNKKQKPKPKKKNKTKQNKTWWNPFQLIKKVMPPFQFIKNTWHTLYSIASPPPVEIMNGTLRKTDSLTFESLICHIFFYRTSLCDLKGDKNTQVWHQMCSYCVVLAGSDFMYRDRRYV